MTDFKFPHRVAALRAAIRTADPAVDGLLVTHLDNVRYLTGFTGSNGLVLLTPTDALFLTDGRYELQASQQVPGFTRVIVPQGTTMQEGAAERARALGLSRLGFEEAHLTVRAFNTLRGALPGADDAAAGVEWVPVNGAVEGVRRVKDADELATMRRAMRLADDCFAFVCETARVGMTERDLAWEMEVFLRARRGAQRLAFDSIVGSGPNSALIHGRPSDRRLGESGGPEFLLLDFGAELDGYCSDLTRTLVVGGEPTDAMRAQYNAVLAAQAAALSAIRPGTAGKDVDALARETITARGFPEFAHGLGHQLGRVVHDGVGLSKLSDVTLVPGMVLTVEPGIYVEGLGGVRIEDDVLVTETGCEVLTASPRELTVVG